MAKQMKTLNGYEIVDAAGRAEIKVLSDKVGEGGGGADGVSPVITTDKSGTVTTITITDAEGTKTVTINDGADGADGADGTSATHSWNGTVLTITSASGTSSADLKGEKGDQGEKGETGAQGAAGADGQDGYTPVKGVDYYTDEEKEEIVTELSGNESLVNNVAEIVKEEVPLIKTAEQPTFVNSVDEMTDTSKVYVQPDGYLYGYREIENYNLYKISEVEFSSRLQNDVEGTTSSTIENVVTGWIPVEYGKYYSLTALYDGVRGTWLNDQSIAPIRLNVKKSDGTILVYNRDSDELTACLFGTYNTRSITIPVEDVVAIRIHHQISELDISTAEKLAVYEPMFVEGDTANEAFTNSSTFEYIDGDAETVAEWYNTGLAYNQPVNYEDRIITLESDVSDIKAGMETLEDSVTNPASTSPYYREVNWGCIPNEYFRGKCDSYSTEGFTNDTQYADYIEKFKTLITGHEAYVTETELGAASDGQSIYVYDFKPVRWDAERTNIPKIIIVAGQHGWEKCNVFGLYYFVKDLLNNWFGSPALDYLRHHTELMIVPVVNTYGFDNFLYKNANGVNINRNYSSNWTLLEDTTSEQYGGAEPFDQPESQIIRDLVLDNSDCVLLIDSHTNSRTNTESWEKLGYYGICNRDDAYFNRIRNALPELVSKISPNFNVDYSLNAPNILFGFLTTSEGNGILRTWACDNDILSVLIEGFAGFVEGEAVSADIFKANEEQMVNWLITAMNYLSK